MVTIDKGSQEDVYSGLRGQNPALNVLLLFPLLPQMGGFDRKAGSSDLAPGGSSERALSRVQAPSSLQAHGQTGSHTL